MKQRLEKWLKRHTLSLVSTGLGLSLSAILLGTQHLDKTKEKKPNWSRFIAEISGYDVVTYAHRDGSRSYVSTSWYPCDDSTKKKLISIVSDRNNDGFPEQKLVLTGCGDGWINMYEKDSRGIIKDYRVFK